MIFNEMFGSYYNCVANIIKLSTMRPVTADDVYNFVSYWCYAESSAYLTPKVLCDEYKLIKKDGTSPLKRVPRMPLSTLQKRWIKSISEDPRFKLFDVEFKGLDDVEPLFTKEDYCTYDSFSDGDPYDNENYIKNFRIVNQAIKDMTALDIWVRTRHGHKKKVLMVPSIMEYSEKDDKFRVIGNKHIINMKNILSVSPSEKKISHESITLPTVSEAVFEITDYRKALERVMFHFSHYSKEAVKISDNKYRVKLRYLPEDETEVLIRLLSFGPVIKVLEPESLVEQMRSRIQKQFATFFP